MKQKKCYILFDDTKQRSFMLIQKKQQSYSRYVRVFGITMDEIKSMPRVEFIKRYGKKFKYMSQSKFLKTVRQIAVDFENGKETLKQYQ